MRKHGGDGLPGKGGIFGFDLHEKARSRPYNWQGKGTDLFFFLFPNSTDSLLSLHFTTANDYNDGCMHGTGLSLLQ